MLTGHENIFNFQKSKWRHVNRSRPERCPRVYSQQKQPDGKRREDKRTNETRNDDVTSCWTSVFLSSGALELSLINFQSRQTLHFMTLETQAGLSFTTTKTYKQKHPPWKYCKYVSAGTSNALFYSCSVLCTSYSAAVYRCACSLQFTFCTYLILKFHKVLMWV